MAQRDYNSSSNQRRRRVWLVLDLDPKKKGSLEQALVALAARLKAMRIDVTFVFATEPAEWMRSALAEPNTEIRELDFRRPVHASATFARWLRQARPDLVHFHFVRAHSSLVLLARASGARVVVHDHITLGQPVVPGFEHSATVKRLVRPLKRLRAAALDGCVDRRLAVSLFVAASVMDAEFFPSARLEVIPNGVDISRFENADAMAVRWEHKLGSRPVIACVSRLAPEKGVDVLIRAVAQLRDDSVLLLAGDGPDVERCKRLAASLGVAERVRFLGLRNDVENIYAAADVVVMPSQWDEAFGLCVVEAMAAAKPVVVTESGAMPEIVANGECGVVVPRGDHEALAGVLQSLLRDRARAGQLGAAARKRAVEVYPIGRWVDGIVAAYGRTLPDLVSAEFIEFTPPTSETPPPKEVEAPEVASG